MVSRVYGEVYPVFVKNVLNGNESALTSKEARTQGLLEVFVFKPKSNPKR